MSFTQWRVQLSSSVAPWTPRLVIHSWECASECTLKAHWLSMMAPCRLTVLSLGLSLATEYNDKRARAAKKNAARILYIDLFIINLLLNVSFAAITACVFRRYKKLLRQYHKLHPHAFMFLAADDGT